MEEKALVGTELKYKVEVTASGFSMDENDFTVEVRRGSRSKVYGKNDMIIREVESEGEGGQTVTETEYYITIDTAFFGSGKYDFITRAYVPDDDFDDGLRTEIDKQSILIVNKL